MKKFFILATMVGAAFTGCVNDEEVVLKQKEDSPKPITFEVAKYKPSSRADGDGTSTTSTGDDMVGKTAFATTQTFGTFAYEKTNTQNAPHTLFMDNVEVVYYTNGNYWAPERQTITIDEEEVELFYTWPTDGHLDFISYYPYTESVVTDGTKTYPSTIPKISDTDAQNTLEYDNYDITSGPHDLMYSDKAVFQTTNSTYYGFTGVPTLFHHALAKLNFAVKAVKLNNHLTAIGETYKHSWEIKINNIKLSNIYKKGSVTLKTNSSSVTSATVTEWTNETLNNSTTTNYNVWTVNTEASNDESVYMEEKTWRHDQDLTTESRIYNGSSTTDPAANYFVIPQTLNDQTITIDYTITTYDSDNVASTPVSTTKTIHFKDITTIPAWEMGKSITYIIEIDPEGDVIHFAPCVVDWEAQSGVISI